MSSLRRGFSPARSRLAGLMLTVCLSVAAPGLSAAADGTADGKDADALTQALRLFATDSKRREALRFMRERGSEDMVAPLIFALRYLGPDARTEVAYALRDITGERGPGDDWFEWMLWQQARPDIQPFASFDTFQRTLFRRIDERFGAFLYAGVAHEIRLEEIVWGGVRKDGIPALDHPAFVRAEEADYLRDREPVFGVAINGDVRAYPYRILDWHEMANDTVGGVPVALAYCTLCGSAILFDRRRTDGAEAFRFGSSGFLYRSNKLMYDQATHSLWNQFTGRPVVGTLQGSGVELPVLPLVTTSWGEWRSTHPDTLVLDPDTGYERDYRPGAPYGSYFASRDLMFPARVESKALDAKAEVFALRISGSEKAWPLKAFRGGRVINDQVGVLKLVVIGDARTRTVRAYRSGGRRFEKAGEHPGKVRADGETWTVREDGLHGPDGTVLSRLPGHLAYFFAWNGYLGEAELATPTR